MSQDQQHDDQNARELSFANQRDSGSARTPLREAELSDEDSAAIAAREKAKPRKDFGVVDPEKQHTRIP